jgi:hypothetical protein
MGCGCKSGGGGGGCKQGGCNVWGGENLLACICKIFVVIILIFIVIGFLIFLWNVYQHYQQQQTFNMPYNAQAANMANPYYNSNYNYMMGPPHAAAAAATTMGVGGRNNMCGVPVFSQSPSSARPTAQCIICGCDMKDKFISCCGYGKSTQLCVPGGCGTPKIL